MAARSLASLTISFGLVSLPVKLYSAGESKAGISFNLLHKECGSRLRQQYVCIAEDVIVEREDMVKGYQFAENQYVEFTKDELKALEEKASPVVEIAEFVPAELIDPVYFDRAYYLAPDKGGEKAYSLLVEAMRQTGRCALARYAARGKQFLVQIRPIEDGLVMQQLLYADEVRPIEEIPITKTEVRDSELKLAIQLIDQISSEAFNPGAYEDDVKKRIQEDIQRKIDGQEISASPAETARPAPVIDLMAALKASIEQRPAPKAGRKPAKRAPTEIARVKSSKR